MQLNELNNKVQLNSNQIVKKDSDQNAIKVIGADKISSLEKRTQWDKPIEFILSCIGYAVGLGNLWRFPYLCMEQGGGAFLVSYTFFLFACGMPLFFMELGLGQYTGLSPVKAFNLAPLFKGIGWSMFLISGFLCIYYNVIIAWVLYYFGSSFQWDVPWRSCNNTWNTPKCFSIYKNLILNNSIIIQVNGQSSTTEFWRHNVLEISDGINNLGGINWKLCACLFAAWLIVFFCLMKGIRSSGKVTYVTATAPYLFLTIILIRGVTLPGSWIGVKFYLMPKWETLLNFQMWYLAAQQIFYSLGPAWGGLITMSSYNRLDHNILRDATVLPVICCATSVFAGFAIFSVIGHMVYVIGETDVSLVMQQGPGLAFVAYPEALAQLPGSAIWSVLFFMMLFTLGLDSQFATLETLTSGLIDEFPNTIGRHKTFFTGIVCLTQFLLGIPLVTRGGFYIFQILDWYSTSFGAMFIGLSEAFVICYIYGIQRLLKNIESMVGPMNKWSKRYWAGMLSFVVPICIILMIIMLAIRFKMPRMDNGELHPAWTNVFGWSIAILMLTPIPLVALMQTIKHRGNMKALIIPTDMWNHSVRRRWRNDLTEYQITQM